MCLKSSLLGKGPRVGRPRSRIMVSSSLSLIGITTLLDPSGAVVLVTRRAALSSSPSIQQPLQQTTFGGMSIGLLIQALPNFRRVHRILPSNPAIDSDPSPSADDSSNRHLKRRRLHYKPRAKIKAVEELSVGFIVNHDVPLSIFTDPFLAQILWQFDTELYDQVSWSRSSMTRHLEALFESGKVTVKQELCNAITKIHLGFDLWTSPNRFAVMAVTGHFLDRQGQQQMRLLALRRQFGSHNGDNLADTLFRVVREWEIGDKVGAIVSDNATNNDRCLQSFYRRLDPGMTTSDIKARRMRCYGHILNLVARAFLFGEDYEAFEVESQVQNLVGSQAEDLRHWRKKGPVGKLLLSNSSDPPLRGVNASSRLPTRPR